MIKNCIRHGVFEEKNCPTCGYKGTDIIHDSDRVNISKHIGWALRHDPEEAGIKLDENGWASIDGVLKSLRERYNEDYNDKITAQELYAVVAFDEKDRYEIDGSKIRATYGHSVDVNVDPNTDAKIPDTLYHGTITENMSNIESEGLKSMGRQSVHLADTIELATSVASRHGNETVVLTIDTEEIQEAGYEIKHSGNSIYTVQEIPANLLSVETKPRSYREIKL